MKRTYSFNILRYFESIFKYDVNSSRNSLLLSSNCKKSYARSNAYKKYTTTVGRRRIITPREWVTYSVVCKCHDFSLFAKNPEGSFCVLPLKTNLTYCQRVCKHTQNRKPPKNEELHDDEYFSDEEGEWEEDFNAEDVHFEEDAEFPPNYRDITGHVKNLRLDSVVRFGLALNRSKVEDYFLASKLKLNGARVLKKSVKLGSGDYVDVITEHRDGIMTVKRVRIVDIKMHQDSTNATVYLRVWRGGAKVPVVKEKFTKKS